MLGALFEQVLPDPDQLTALWDRVSASGATTVDQDQLRLLSERVLPPPSQQ
jgi:hypothetical protein